MLCLRARAAEFFAAVVVMDDTDKSALIVVFMEEVRDRPDTPVTGGVEEDRAGPTTTDTLRLTLSPQEAHPVYCEFQFLYSIFAQPLRQKYSSTLVF